MGHLGRYGRSCAFVVLLAGAILGASTASESFAECLNDIGDMTITRAVCELWVGLGKPEVWCCENNSTGDSNLDGFVNGSDITPIRNSYGSATTYETANADLNRDGFIGAADITVILHHLGQEVDVCPNVPFWPPLDCLPVGATIGDIYVTQDIYERWAALGKPEVWCCTNNSMGDANLDGFVNGSDTTPILNSLVSPTTYNNANADLNRDGFINASDTTLILNRLHEGVGTCPDLSYWPPVP